MIGAAFRAVVIDAPFTVRKVLRLVWLALVALLALGSALFAVIFFAEGALSGWTMAILAVTFTIQFVAILLQLHADDLRREWRESFMRRRTLAEQQRIREEWEARR